MGNLIKFIIGGLLIAGSLLFGFALIFGGMFTLVSRPDSLGILVIWGVIDFIVFLVGVFLVRS